MEIWRASAAIVSVNHKNVELYHKFKPVAGGKQVQAACTPKIIYRAIRSVYFHTGAIRSVHFHITVAQAEAVNRFAVFFANQHGNLVGCEGVHDFPQTVFVFYVRGLHGSAAGRQLGQQGFGAVHLHHPVAPIHISGIERGVRIAADIMAMHVPTASVFGRVIFVARRFGLSGQCGAQQQCGKRQAASGSRILVCISFSLAVLSDGAGCLL